ncbi:MAG TPA: M12 family metallo-peptidase, partial [Phycisphaerae bacterium]|nr:M12 family metallo-peptidase [Phycisphaerae bacterium]
MRLYSVLTIGVLAIASGAASAFAQMETRSSDGLWQAVSRVAGMNDMAVPWGGVMSYQLVQLEQAGLQNVLALAPPEAKVAVANSSAVITLPMPDGSFQRFTFVDSPVMAPELAAKYPQIRTYLGQGLDDPYATARFDWTPAGFHGLVLSPSGTVMVDPYIKGQTDLYVSFYRHDVSAEAAAWTCYTDDRSGPVQDMGIGVLGSSGVDLRVYRVAVATNGEYTQFHGGTVAQGLAAVTTAINRITGIFEQEFCIRLQLVANNNLIIYTNPATDPYTGDNNSTMMSENQANLDSVIGSANYDIGHVFTTAGGGVTFVGVACRSGEKAKAASGRGTPTSDAFVVEIAAHEMGHQVGSHHTWNGTLGGCTTDQWGSATACEPGSGSTIMAYPGLCSTDNIQSSRDYYYHAISYEKIRSYVVSGAGNGCPTILATGNSPPTVNAGPDYTIPKETPFVLTASGSDPDGHSITYCWEEMDLGPQAPLADGDNGSSPIFRSWLPTTSPSRTFPRLSDLLNNTTAKGESLPTTGRTLKMRCTVRDNRAGGGGVNNDDVVLTVTASAGPFTVTSPNTAVTWSGTRTVTWNVANTNAAPVNCSQVNIRLSVDGGNTYPYLLAANTPNDGSQSVTLPEVPSTQARIKVEAVGNIFFDISDVNFSIPCPAPDVATNVNATDGSYPYVYVTWTLPVGDPVGLSHCQIWRSTTNNSATATLLEDNWTATGYQDASTTPYATNYYWIKIVNLCGGTSAFSASDSGWRVLGPPANVTASDGAYIDKVRVAWDAGGGTHYRVYRNTTNNSATATAMTSWITSLLWDDTTAAPGSLYYYWVQAAMSSAGAQPSDFSAYNTGWRALTPPTVEASKGTSAEHVLVQWDSPTGATHYCVYRGVSGNSSEATALTGWITGNSYADTTTPAGVSYYYWVKAAVSSSGLRETGLVINDVGWKAYAPPANVSATDGTDDTR